MITGIRRLGGVVAMAAGIACAAWLAFGSPQDWEGTMRYVRFALGLASTGAITGGARLIFWDPQGDGDTAAAEQE